MLVCWYIARVSQYQCHELNDGARVICRKPMCDAPTSVVADHRERVVSKRAHQFELIERHFTFAVIRMIRLSYGLTGIAVSTQIRMPP